MPLTEAGAMLIAGGAAAATSGVNMGVQAARNKKQLRNWYKQQDKLNELQIAAEQRQFDYNQQIRDDIFAQNIAQWNRENAYNAPSAQIERYKAAGLNSNLIYGQPTLAAGSPEMSSPGSVGSGSPSVASAVDVSAPQIDFSSFTSDMLNMSEVRRKDAETLNLLNDNDFKDATFSDRVQQIKEELLNTIADTTKKGAETQNIDSDTVGKNIKNDVDLAIKDTKIEQAKTDLEKSKSDVINTKKTYDLLNAQINDLKLDAKIKRHIERIQKYESDIKKVDAQYADTFADQKKRQNEVNISWLNQQTAFLGKKIGSYDKELQAKLLLSAATTLMYNKNASFTESKTQAQDLQNLLNNILLNPREDVDNIEYFSALVLKLADSATLKDIIDVLGKDNKKSGAANSDNDSEIEESIWQKSFNNLSPEKQKIAQDFIEKHEGDDDLIKQFIQHLFYGN